MGSRVHGRGAVVTLRDRIKEAERQRESDLRYLHPSKPIPFKPRWLERATKDMTDSVLYNGAWQKPTEGGAA